MAGQWVTTDGGWYKFATGGAATTTFNPTGNPAAITLSNGNLTATDNTGGAGNVSAGSLTTHSTGKYYCEFTPTFTAGAIIGIANSSESTSFPAGVYDNNGIGYAPDGQIWMNGVNPSGSPVASYASTNVVCMAVDMDNLKIYWRVGSGNWNNNVSANPATNTGGISFSTMAAGPWFAKWSSGGTLNDTVTANFGGSAYAQSVPSGFGNW